jgi:uncharacterized membrane protein YjdF
MKAKRWSAEFAVAAIATLLMIALSAVAPQGSTYRISFLFLGAIMWLVYAVRARLHLGAFHLALVASALLLHNLGVFGWYRREFWGLQFDTYVHFYFGVVGGFVVRAGLEGSYGLRGWRVWIAVTLGILGLGAIHELIEFASTLALGPERGMLKALADDPYDTQKDLMNNLLGTLLALMCSSMARIWRRKSSAETTERLRHRTRAQEAS